MAAAKNALDPLGQSERERRSVQRQDEQRREEVPSKRPRRSEEQPCEPLADLPAGQPVPTGKRETAQERRLLAPGTNREGGMQVATHLRTADARSFSRQLREERKKLAPGNADAEDLPNHGGEDKSGDDCPPASKPK